MRNVLRTVLVVMMMAGACGGAVAAPQAPVVFTRTVGNLQVRMVLPPGAIRPTRQPDNGSTLYVIELADDKGKPKLRVLFNLSAGDRQIPKSEADRRSALVSMMKASRLPIKDDQIRHKVIGNANKQFDFVHGGFYTFNSKNGNFAIVSPNVLASKKGDVMVPFSIFAESMQKNEPRSEVKRAQDWMGETMREMIRSASVTKK